MKNKGLIAGTKQKSFIVDVSFDLMPSREMQVTYTQTADDNTMMRELFR